MKNQKTSKEAVFYCSYKLVKGASVPDFLLASEKLNNEHISKQKGYISWQQLVDGDTWLDFCTFATMDDVKTFASNSEKEINPLAEKFYSFIDMASCKAHFFTIERSY